MRAVASLQVDSTRGLPPPMIPLSAASDEEERGKSPFGSLSTSPFLLQELFRSLPEKQSAIGSSPPQCTARPLTLDDSPLPQSEPFYFPSPLYHKTQLSQALSASAPFPTLVYRSPESSASQNLMMPENYKKHSNYSSALQPKIQSFSSLQMPFGPPVDHLYRETHMINEAVDASKYPKTPNPEFSVQRLNGHLIRLNEGPKGSQHAAIDYSAFTKDPDSRTGSKNYGPVSLVSSAPLNTSCRASSSIGERYMNDRQRNPCKVFVGGIGQGTVESTIREYFKRFGEVVECGLVTHKKSGKSRGFGFVTYATADAALRAIQAKHKIDDVLVECREALPREEARSAAPEDLIHVPTKVFVGGIPDRIHEEELREFFARFGNVLDVSLAYDKTTHRPRGFGFVVFSTIREATRAVGEHILGGKVVEVKHAIPRSLAASGRQRNARGSPSAYPANTMGGNFASYNSCSTSNTDSITSALDPLGFAEIPKVPLRLQQEGSNTFSYQTLSHGLKPQHYADQIIQEQSPNLNVETAMTSHEMAARRRTEVDEARKSSALWSSIFTAMSLKSQFQDSQGACEGRSSMHNRCSGTLPSPFEFLGRKRTPRSGTAEALEELAPGGVSRSLFSHSHPASEETAETHWHMELMTPSVRGYESQHLSATVDDCASTDCSSHSECDTSYLPTISLAPAVCHEEKATFSAPAIRKTDFLLTPPLLFENCSKAVDSSFASQPVCTWLGRGEHPSTLLSPQGPGAKRGGCDRSNIVPEPNQDFQIRVWTDPPTRNGSAMAEQTERVAVASAANVLCTSSPISLWTRLNDAEQQRLQRLLGSQAGLEREQETDSFVDDHTWRLGRASPVPYFL